jgi:hypothetical protein
VGQGSLRFVDFDKVWPALGSEVGTFLAAAGGVGLVLRVRGWAILRHAVHGVLLPPAVTLTVALLLPRTPAVYQHAWLPLLPTVAVYAGLTLATLGEWARRGPSRGRRALALVAIGAAVVVPAGELVRLAIREQNAADLHLMRRELRLACPGEPVLDGTALAVFRPTAHRYGVLIRGVREWVARGVIAEEVIAGDMLAARAPVAHADRRVRGMIGPVADFLRAHYVPGADGLLVAGAEVIAPGEDGRKTVDLLRPGPHLVTFDRDLHVALDRTPVARGWVTLAAGRHEVTWRGKGGTIRLVAATCPERQALALRGA